MNELSSPPNDDHEAEVVAPLLPLEVVSQSGKAGAESEKAGAAAAAADASYI